MSVLGTTKHSSCNQCIDTWQYSYIVIAVVKRQKIATTRHLIFHLLSLVYMLFCSLKRGLTWKIHILCFVMIK